MSERPAETASQRPPDPANGGCNACGRCCDPVWYPFGAGDIRQSAAVTGSRDLAFAASHWTPTGQRRAGLHGYSCDRFDRETRLCTAHDDRPPICRAYPAPASLRPEGCTAVLPTPARRPR